MIVTFNLQGLTKINKIFIYEWNIIIYEYFWYELIFIDTTPLIPRNFNKTLELKFLNKNKIP